MRVVVDSWAWFSAESLGELQKESLRRALTIMPRKTVDYGDDVRPIPLFIEDPNRGFGVARQFFFAKKTGSHDVVLNVSEGDRSTWPGNVAFTATLRDEQQQALGVVAEKIRLGEIGGIVQAPPGWGKTVFACALIAHLQVPTLVVVHKKFLMTQWRDRILGNPEKKVRSFLPNAAVGYAQQNVCDYRGKNIVIAMVHSLVEHPYPPEFFDWPGLIIFDEVHRVAAQTWSRVPPRFSSRWRIGLSATPRRKDGAENVFRYHIGPVMFAGKERRLAPSIRRVYTTFRVVRTPMFNPSLMKHNLLLRFMCANETRNRQIIQQLVLAVLSGRKILILSERLNHLKRLQDLLIKSWPSDKGPVPSIGYHVGGMSEDDLYAATECRVILATVQYVTEALDIPALDTLFLVTPLADVEQAVGRILRPFEGKKNPVVVDFIDSQVPQCVSMAEKRDRQYTKMVRQ